ncbi:dUTP diphosphatase [Trichuris suis]|nr:dUTP diphosphatase [Trichuris suis]
MADISQKLRVSKLSGYATTPTRGSSLAAGFDLYSAYEYEILPGGNCLCMTDIQVAIPEGCYGRVAPRSGLAVKHCIDVGAGVIDGDYRGNVGVVLFNFGKEKFSNRVANSVLEKMEKTLHSERNRLKSHLDLNFRADDVSVSNRQTAGRLLKQIEDLQKELKFRICENEDLQRKLRDMELVHEKEMYGLTEKMKVIQQEADSCRQDLKNVQKVYRNNLQNLEKHMLICNCKSNIPHESFPAYTSKQPSPFSKSHPEGDSAECDPLALLENAECASLCSPTELSSFHTILAGIMPIIIRLVQSYSNLFSYYNCRSRFFVGDCPSSYQLTEVSQKVCRNCDALSRQLSIATVNFRSDFKNTFEVVTRCFAEQKECFAELIHLLITW